MILKSKTSSEILFEKQYFLFLSPELMIPARDWKYYNRQQEHLYYSIDAYCATLHPTTLFLVWNVIF